MIHRHWMTNMNIAKFDRNKDPLCARCTTMEETFEHIFACKSSHAKQTHQKAITIFKTDLRKCDTAPIAQRAMIQCIKKHRRWYENLTFKDLIISDNTKELARRIFKKQQDIGHLSYLQGYIITDWVLLQKIYLKWLIHLGLILFERMFHLYQGDDAMHLVSTMMWVEV